MNLILHYGFDELSLFRIWLATNGYNTRAIRLYEKLGFREEGRLREHIHRDDQRWDFVIMGLLRHEFTRM